MLLLHFRDLNIRRVHFRLAQLIFLITASLESTGNPQVLATSFSSTSVVLLRPEVAE